MNYLLDEKLIKANVVNISWERINLYIDVKVEFSANSSGNIPLSFYAVNQRYAAKAKFEVLEIFEGNIYRLYLNVTNPGYSRCLQRGQYNIHVCYEENDLAICMADPSIVKIMNNFSRSFFYTAKTRVYNVFFYVDRAADMQTMIDDDDINAIICARGGYGAIRIVNLIDYSRLFDNPKWLVGFSDITVFHAKLHALDVASIHGVMAKGFPNVTLESIQSLHDILFGEIQTTKIQSNARNRFLPKGCIEGCV